MRTDLSKRDIQFEVLIPIYKFQEKNNGFLKDSSQK